MFNTISVDKLSREAIESAHEFLELFGVDTESQKALINECSNASEIINVMFKAESGKGGIHKSQANCLKAVVTGAALKAYYGEDFDLYASVNETQGGASEKEVFIAHDEIYWAKNVCDTRCDAHFLESTSYISPFRFNHCDEPIHVIGTLKL
ncbi:hypothetical protein [Vibrio owensii]|uniref:hypothetical protein n=1 Tax=Vibrio harveyi group TaxID=717610 RepID=UPI003CC5081A